MKVLDVNEESSARKENINTKYYIIRPTIKEKGHITCQEAAAAAAAVEVAVVVAAAALVLEIATAVVIVVVVVVAAAVNTRDYW